MISSSFCMKQFRLNMISIHCLNTKIQHLIMAKRAQKRATTIETIIYA